MTSSVLLVLCALFPGATGTSFLLISAPLPKKVSYVAVPDAGLTAVAQPQTLIDQGLQFPLGLAVDQRRKKLFVADADAKNIYSYTLTVDGNKLLTSSQGTAVRNFAARWVAVDGVGNVFFSNEAGMQIMKVPSEKVLRGEAAPPEVVYDAATVASVSAPGGVAVDNFHVFWANKMSGTTAGSVVRAQEVPLKAGSPAGVHALSNNVLQSYGVCIALNNVYYTDAAKNIYGVKKSGGEEALISEQLDKPRGCAWDGDGTVFVADKGAGAVYSFAGNMHTLAKVEMTKIADMEDAFGVAVLSTAAARLPGVVLTLLAAAVAGRAVQ